MTMNLYNKINGIQMTQTEMMKVCEITPQVGDNDAVIISPPILEF